MKKNVAPEKPANFKVNATLNEKGRYYHHFGIHPTLAMMYGDKPEDIVELEMKVSNDQTVPPANEKDLSVDYWGWYDSEKNEFTKMIYAKRFLLEMCFPYGIKRSEESGQGKAYRLEIVNVGNVIEKD